MTTFGSASSLAALFAIPSPNTVGVPLSAHDRSGALFSVQVASDNPALETWGTGGAQWGVALWGMADSVHWVDVTDRVRGLEWSRGSTDPILQPEVGVATLTFDNRDGAVSPWATSGPFADSFATVTRWDISKWDVPATAQAGSLIRPNTAIRFGVWRPDVGYLPFFTGLIESIEENTQDNVDAWVTLTVGDITAGLAAIGNGNSALATGGSVHGPNMAAELFADVAWAYTQEYGGVAGDLFHTAVFQAPDIASNRLTALQLIATSGQYLVIGTSSGSVRLVGPNVVDTGDTFSNNPAAGELPVVLVTPYASTDRLLNQVAGTRVGGATQQVADVGSIKQFGLYGNALGWPRDDLLLSTDPDVETLVESVLLEHSRDFLGVSALSLDADQDPVAMYDRMAIIASTGLETASRFSVRWQHPSGAIWAAKVRLTGFTQSLTMEGGQAKWTASYLTCQG